MSNQLKQCKSCSKQTTNPIYCSTCSERVKFICQEIKNKEGKIKNTDLAYGKNLLNFPPRKLSKDETERIFCVACKQTTAKTEIGKHTCSQMKEKTLDEWVEDCLKFEKQCDACGEKVENPMPLNLGNCEHLFASRIGVKFC